MANVEALTPIYSEEMEKAVLGCLIFHSETQTTLEQLRRDDFFVPAHQLLFRGVKALIEAGIAIEPSTLHQWLTDHNLAKEAGSPGVLTELGNAYATPMNIGTYVKTVQEKARLRRAATLAHDLWRGIHDMPDDLPALLEGFQASLSTITNGQAKSSLSVRSVADLLGMTFDDSDNWLGDRVMAEGQNVTLLGPGGIGKSRLALQLALCMIMGRPFVGLETHASGKKWLFIQTENSNRRLQDDLVKMLKALRPTNDEVDLINAGLRIHTIETEKDAFLDVENPLVAQELGKLIHDEQPDVVVWDPLNTLTTLDLNSDQDMRLVVTAVTSLTKRGNPNRVPLILHHSLTGKAGAARAMGWDKASYGRNSKVLQAWTRAQLNLAPRDADDSTLLLLTCGKNNNGAPFSDIGIKFHEPSGLYEADDSFDSQAFREEMAGETKKVNRCPVEKVVAMVAERPMTRSELARVIIEDLGLSRSKAYDKIAAAEAAKRIKEERFSRKLVVITA